MKPGIDVLQPTCLELDVDKLLAGVLIGLLLVMLATLAKRVRPEDLASAADNDEIPTLILEGP